MANKDNKFGTLDNLFYFYSEVIFMKAVIDFKEAIRP